MTLGDCKEMAQWATISGRERKLVAGIKFLLGEWLKCAEWGRRRDVRCEVLEERLKRVNGHLMSAHVDIANLDRHLEGEAIVAVRGRMTTYIEDHINAALRELGESVDDARPPGSATSPAE